MTNMISEQSHQNTISNNYISALWTHFNYRILLALTKLIPQISIKQLNWYKIKVNYFNKQAYSQTF